jgi:hypothetical protein
MPRLPSGATSMIDHLCEQSSAEGKGADDAGLVDANELDKAKRFETHCVGAEGISPIR